MRRTYSSPAGGLGAHEGEHFIGLGRGEDPGGFVEDEKPALEIKFGPRRSPTFCFSPAASWEAGVSRSRCGRGAVAHELGAETRTFGLPGDDGRDEVTGRLRMRFSATVMAGTRVKCW